MSTGRAWRLHTTQSLGRLMLFFSHFRYGYITWEWQEGLRSFLHPSIFALLYKILQVTNLDHPWMMTTGPRILQAFFAALCDYYLYKLAKKRFNSEVAKWAVSTPNYFYLCACDFSLHPFISCASSLIGLLFIACPGLTRTPWKPLLLW